MSGVPADLREDLARLVEGRHHDPFATLGRHRQGESEIVRTYLPGAERVSIAEPVLALEPIEETGVFEWRGAPGTVPERYRLRWRDADGTEHARHDPYAFPPQIGDLDLHLFGEGRHWHAWRFLGAHPREVDGIAGVLFATWAPNAERVSVVGDFNRWDGRRHPMRSRGGGGVWELFVPELGPGTLYKFEIRTRAGTILAKTDPYGRRFEPRPATASIVDTDRRFDWGDSDWMRARESWDWQHSPVSIYEAHLGSWRRGADGAFLSYREMAEPLAAHVTDLGFTHVELLPISEHALDESWGYQTTGFFAPTSRHGTPDDFRHLVDTLHRRGIGVILDWVPGHFPRDAWALAHFDGTALYEHADPRRGEQPDWGTLVFNYARNEVRSFLVSNALYWLEEFHVDGLRVDAVASMLYLDYSRRDGQWTPNAHGGRENLEAIAFLREVNGVVQGQRPGTVTIAEESTAWPLVTRPAWLGGLGFAMKWNMGWMHDSLEYLGHDPVHRKFHHDRLTFGMLYAHTENFVLPLSHDEVVHGKRALLEKMPGDDWRKFANLRLLYAYQWTYPGKKLLFMGGEIAQRREWSERGSIEWDLLAYPAHGGVMALVRDLNRLYRDAPALHRYDFEPGHGFEWIDCHDVAQSIVSYLRREGDDVIVVCLNFTPVPREGYRIGLPAGGYWREVLNTDAECYGGSDLGNGGGVEAERFEWMGRAWSAPLTLPPLAAIVLRGAGAAR